MAKRLNASANCVYIEKSDMATFNKGLFLSRQWGPTGVTTKLLKIQSSFFSKKVSFWGALKFVTS